MEEPEGEWTDVFFPVVNFMTQFLKKKKISKSPTKMGVGLSVYR